MENVFFLILKTVLNMQMVNDGTARPVKMGTFTTKTLDNVSTVIFRNVKNASGFNPMAKNTNHV